MQSRSWMVSASENPRLIATKWKEPSKDALDTLVLKASMLDRAFLDTHEQLDFKPFDLDTQAYRGDTQIGEWRRL